MWLVWQGHFCVGFVWQGHCRLAPLLVHLNYPCFYQLVIHPVFVFLLADVIVVPQLVCFFLKGFVMLVFGSIPSRKYQLVARHPSRFKLVPLS